MFEAPFNLLQTQEFIVSSKLYPEISDLKHLKMIRQRAVKVLNEFNRAAVCGNVS